MRFHPRPSPTRWSSDWPSGKRANKASRSHFQHTSGKSLPRRGLSGPPVPPPNLHVGRVIAVRFAVAEGLPGPALHGCPGGDGTGVNKIAASRLVDLHRAAVDDCPYSDPPLCVQYRFDADVCTPWAVPLKHIQRARARAPCDCLVLPVIEPLTQIAPRRSRLGSLQWRLNPPAGASPYGTRVLLQAPLQLRCGRAPAYPCVVPAHASGTAAGATV